MSRLSQALKARFDSPADALRAMDIDPSVLRDTEFSNSERGGHFDPRGNTGGEVLGGVERRGEDRHRRRADDRDPPIEHPSPRQNEYSAAEDDEDEDERRVSMDEFEDYLRDHGMSEDDIPEAMDMVRRHARDRARAPRRNGYDRHADDRRNARDRLPHRAGHFEKRRFSRDESPRRNGAARSVHACGHRSWP